MSQLIFIRNLAIKVIDFFIYYIMFAMQIYNNGFAGFTCSHYIYVSLSCSFNKEKFVSLCLTSDKQQGIFCSKKFKQTVIC